MWLKISIAVLVFLIIAFGAALCIGTRRWRSTTNAFVTRLTASRAASGAGSHHAQEVETLPAPVARYFRAVLCDGLPLIGGARILQERQFRSK